MHVLSYQYVTGCVAFRAEVQRSIKERGFLFFVVFFFKKRNPGQFSALISALQPHCLAVSGSYKDSKLREQVVSKLLPLWTFLSSFIGYHSVWWSLTFGFPPVHGGAGRATLP